MADIAFKALAFLRTSLSDVLALRLQSYFRRHDWVCQQAISVGQRLHAFEARVSRTTSRKSGDSVQNKNDNINKLADTVAKAVVDAAALSLLMVEVARSKDGSSKPKSASINTERLEQHLDVLQRELEEVKQLLEANEQMQRQGQRPD
eukprot:jgi/Botrbrau1/12310/Bobra.0205s0008.2